MKTKFLLVLLILAACKTTKPVVLPRAEPTILAVPGFPRPLVSNFIRPAGSGTRTDAFLEGLLRRNGVFNEILANKDSMRVQVIYTQINRRSDNSPVLKRFYFNVNKANYFYPASVVKLPVAMLALQRLNELRLPGLTSGSTMITESGYGRQTAVYNDPTTPEGKPTVSQYIKKIFLASDNDAFNRLYEFLGQSYINDRLHQMGYPEADILHRLSVSSSEDENRHTNPVDFFDERGNILYGQPMQVNRMPYAPRTEQVGSGYLVGTRRVDSAMSFASKNRIGLEDLTTMLQSVVFPESVPLKQRFTTSPDDRDFVMRQMSAYPSESVFPAYDTASHWDAAGKMLLFGAEKGPLPAGIRIFNKIGGAYGFLTDVAYIVDFEKKIEFMLSATIYCNQDGIINDDRYDYDRMGLPFMKNLGRMLYDHELKRGRLNEPDLSAFKINY